MEGAAPRGHDRPRLPAVQQRRLRRRQGKRVPHPAPRRSRAFGDQRAPRGGDAMNDAPQSSKALYARLLRYVWPYRAALFGGIVAMVIGGLADASIVKLSEPLLNQLFV